MLQFFRPSLFLLIFLVINNSANAQFKQTGRWKALVALGFNYPTTDGFVAGTYAQSINFPTVNLGIQHMFKKEYGLRLDYGFNRFKNDNGSPEFKINYSRINAQFVFDLTDNLSFVPRRMRTILHAGPGYSFTKPLGNLGGKEQSYFNVLGGFELHYAINEKVSLFTDIAYIYGLTSLEDYKPPLDGLGAFNGSVFNVTLGLAISLSGCQYCD